MKTVSCSSDPYSGLITQFIHSEFPRKDITSKNTLIDLLVEEILASGAVRYGPRPPAEVQVNLKHMVERWVKEGRPIPFLVPWGSIKPHFGGVDIAELSGLKTLQCLNDRISRHYGPGTEMNLRIEDISGFYMFAWMGEHTRPAIQEYSTGLEQLIKALDLRFINPMPESRLVTEEKFGAEADSISGPMLSHLKGEHGAFAKIKELGWTGSISPEMITFYKERYATHYPDIPDGQRLELLASYLSQALARVRLGVRGGSPLWGKLHGEVAFVPSAPGTLQHFGHRVVYRTIPESMTRNHMPAWRAKGYLRIRNNNSVRPALASQKEANALELNECHIVISNGDVTIRVQSDYVIAP